MDIFSELRQAQVECLSADPVAHVKNRLYGKDTSAPLMIDDGTTFHKVLTDQMASSIKTLLYPSGIQVANLDPAFSLPASNLASGIPSTKITQNYVLSSSISGSTTSTTFSEITGLTTVITATGSRPVEIGFINGLIQVWDNARIDRNFGYFQITRNGTLVGEFNIGQAIDISAYQLNSPASGTQGNRLLVPASIIRCVDPSPVAGSNTYKVLYKSEASSVQVAVTSVQLLVREF